MGRPPKRVSQENIERFQSELEEAGQDVELLLKDKKGRSRSCLLCQRRKRRCDHKLPSCTACLKAAVKCIQPAKYVSKNPQPVVSSQQTPVPMSSQTENNKDGKDEYARFLEKKLKYLEKMLDLPPTGASFKNKLSNYKKISHLLENEDGEHDPLPQLQRVMYSEANLGSQASSSSSPILPPPQKSKIFPLPSDSMTSNTLITPPNIHPSSSLAALSTDTLESIDFSKCIFAKYNLKEFLRYDPAFEFEEQLSRAFLDIYFTRLQFKYPLLDEQEIYSFHKDYISNNVHSYSTQEFHFACGRMWLIFSISACLHKSTGKYKGLPPNRYFSTAIRHITKCGSGLTYIQQVEVLTLLVLYIIRTDRDSIGLYEIMGDVMAICKEKLFLNKWNPQDTFANKKLRLFWCVYLLERMICVAVGKPYTISESEIDLPFFNEDSFNTNSISHQKRHKRGVHFINQSLKLRRIESEFVETLQIISQYVADRSDTTRSTSELAEQLPLVKKFFHDLEVWRSNCSTSHVRNFENETLKLYYYRSVRLLIQPYLELLELEDRLFRECQAAAGQICQLYKIFHQKTVYGHSTPAVHTVFVAGVTLIYCMWLARNLDDERRRKLGDDSKHTRPLISPSLFSTLDDLRACSVCLYVMAERSKFAIIFRDTFDQLMNATIGNLIERCGPDSAELIYIATSSSSEAEITPGTSNEEILNGEIKNFPNLPDQEGMPPAIRRTFGKFQASEHVGFVENSQIDLAEQRELQKKQGDLEKVAVPKKLSYLLVKDEEKEEVHHAAQGGKLKHGCSQKQKERDRYVVKKPSHITEADWEGFQQQAFLQQHHAQQTLQAYLASLNKKINSEVASANLSSYGPSHENSNIIGQPPSVSTVGRNASNIDDFKQIPLSTEGSPPRWNNENTRVAQNQNFPVLGNISASQVNSPPFFQRPLGKASPNSMDAGEILFNNGAHTMINNISSWTNDSVADLMSTRLPDQELTLQQNNIMINSLQKTTATADGNGTAGNHMNMLPSDGQWRSSDQGGRDMQQHELQTYHLQQARRSNDPSNAQQIQGGNQIDTVFGMPVEEFWTVNDDYGFLA